MDLWTREKFLYIAMLTTLLTGSRMEPMIFMGNTSGVMSAGFTQTNLSYVIHLHKYKIPTKVKLH